MATWMVAETADEKFDIETFFTLNGQVLETGSGEPDIVYYRTNPDQPTYYVIHADKDTVHQGEWVDMDFETHIDGGNQSHAALSDIQISRNDFNTLTATKTGADVASVLFDGNDTLTGSSHDDILRGYAGTDKLDGGAGADALYGGDGDDSYVVDDTGDVVNELKGDGTDTVKASADFTLGAFVENLALTGTDDLDGRGNGLANTINGNAGGNFLFGLEGADVINGAKGDDSLFGGGGQDSLTGGKGADTFFFNLGETAVAKAKADEITDFHASQGDLIDLHVIDANEGKNNNQAFHFTGTDAFSHHAGELRFEHTAHDSYVMGDTDGNGKADFTIHLIGDIALTKDAFIL